MSMSNSGMRFEFPAGLVVYRTDQGVQLSGDSRDVLKLLPEGSVDLVVTSPPFALLREKSYGNKAQEVYVEWLVEFGQAAYGVLKPTGSLVLDIGGAYQRGRPVRSLYNYRILIEFCDNLGYRLAEEFFWYNPAKLPSPIEWVNKRKIRVKDAVNPVWWFSKEDYPKADVTKVLVPYSKRMKKLLADPEKYYDPKKRPSGHDISASFGNDRGGAIPPNLLQIPNTASNSHYLRWCKELGYKRHPARFPAELPRFFIKFLTDPGDLVVDIFSGSNTTGYVAGELGRRWIAIEKERQYAWLSAVRFMKGWDSRTIVSTIDRLKDGESLNLNAVKGVRRQLKLPVV